MRAKIDLQRKGLHISGQPLILSTSTTSSFNPLACCMPTSTSTSSFSNVHQNNNSFLPFVNILWVEETDSSKPHEVEITYVYPFQHNNKNNNNNAGFKLPYEDAKLKLYPTTQILTIETNDQDPFDRDIKLSTLIMKYSYPHSEFKLNIFKPQSIFVLINPHSGTSEALNIFNRDVKPILTSSHCELTIQLTEYKGHATELARSINIDQYDTILCASGDGIPYEVINGLYERADRAKAFSKINIVQTPGGSGNAMSLSCLGATSASLAALRILKGTPSQCDLMAISKESSDSTIVSFLSQTYGAIAQADIGTEWMRGVGDIRFDLGVVYEVLAGKKYPCDLAVKWKHKTKADIYKHYEDQTKNKHCNDDSHIYDHKNDVIPKDQDYERSESIQLKKLNELCENDFELKYHSFFKRSKSFNSLPDDWEVYDKDTTNNMRIFYAGKMPYIASTTNFFPAALPSDGAIDLVVFDSRSNFFSTANALLSLDKGTHVCEDCVEHTKVEAFRFIPKGDKNCFISVDGEWFPNEAFQVEILKGILRTILWEGEFTSTGFLENKVY